MHPILKKKSTWVLAVSALVLVWAAQTAYRALSTEGGMEDVYSLLQEGNDFPGKMPLMGLDGKLTTFEPYQGKVVLINYWASWCGPCVKEMPGLYAIYQKYETKGFVILGVSMDDNAQQGVDALSKMVGKPPFPIVRGTEQAIYHRFPIEGLPFTVIVDRQGKIRYARPGERDWQSAESVKFIEESL